MRISLSLTVLAVIFFFSLMPSVFSQQQAAQPQQAALPPQEEVSWLWGEVKVVDPVSSSLTVLYMDYQTDEEKELLLIIDANTQFEAVQGLNAVKIGDTASIDYVTENGKNIAKNISIETIEAMPEAPAQPAGEPAKDPAAAGPKAE